MERPHLFLLTGLDDIEVNVISMRDHTRNAMKELSSASRWQKSARKRACWLMLILCIIVTVVLLAVSISLLQSLTVGTELEDWTSRVVIAQNCFR